MNAPVEPRDVATCCAMRSTALSIFVPRPLRATELMTVIISTSTMSCSPFSPDNCATICDVTPPTTRAAPLRPPSSLTSTVNVPVWW
eukprot:7383192-Prymnesium_polylepis.1